MPLVSGKYLGPDDAPARGSVRFVLDKPPVDMNAAQRTAGPVVPELDDAGTFSVTLFDNATYTVTESVTGLTRGPWSLTLAGEPVDLPSRYPGDSPAGTGWGSVATEADLPASAPLGTKLHVAAGVGLQIMVWDGAGWKVAPESDTGEVLLAPYMVNGWENAVGYAAITAVRRQGANVAMNLYGLTGAAATNYQCMNLPPGFGAMRATGSTFFCYALSVIGGVFWVGPTYLGQYAPCGVYGPDWAQDARPGILETAVFYRTGNPWPTSLDVPVASLTADQVRKALLSQGSSGA